MHRVDTFNIEIKMIQTQKKKKQMPCSCQRVDKLHHEFIVMGSLREHYQNCAKIYSLADSRWKIFQFVVASSYLIFQHHQQLIGLLYVHVNWNVILDRNSQNVLMTINPTCFDQKSLISNCVQIASATNIIWEIVLHSPSFHRIKL